MRLDAPNKNMPVVSRFVPLPVRMVREGRGAHSFLAILTESSYPEIVADQQYWFHPTEWARVNGLHFEKRRREYVLGRCACKLAISAYLGELLRSRLQIETGVFGQPLLRFPSDRPPELSITHTDTVAVSMASEHGCPIGIDIERISNRSIGFLSGHVTQNDLQQLKDIVPDAQAAYLRVWTIKEALSKALRCGITVPFALLEVQSVEVVDAHTLRCGYRNFPQYQCYSWVLGQFLFAVAVPRSVTLYLRSHELLACMARAGVGDLVAP